MEKRATNKSTGRFAAEQIAEYRRSEKNFGLSDEAINKRLLLEEFQRIEVSKDFKILALKEPLSPSFGKIAVLVTSEGKVYKAIAASTAKLAEYSDQYVIDQNKIKWYIHGELKKLHHTGYWIVYIPTTGKKLAYLRHMLVAHAFGLTPGNYGPWVINHIQGKVYGDCMENLEACTVAENCAHAAFKNNLKRWRKIKYINVSAKDGLNLKYFTDAILSAIDNKKGERYGHVYSFRNIMYTDVSSGLKIEGDLVIESNFPILGIPLDTREYCRRLVLIV